MQLPHSVPPEKPSLELFTAYLDGELDAEDWLRVEAWLSDHPEDREEVERQRCILELLHDHPPPSPTEEQWKAVLDGIVAATSESRVLHTPKQLPWFRISGAAAVAAMLLSWVLYARFVPTTDRVQPPLELPVAALQDVEIITMDGEDFTSLVVGLPPLRGPMELASAQDVTIETWGRDVEVVLPGPANNHPATPMIVVPDDPLATRAP